MRIRNCNRLTWNDVIMKLLSMIHLGSSRHRQATSTCKRGHAYQNFGENCLEALNWQSATFERASCSRWCINTAAMSRILFLISLCLGWAASESLLPCHVHPTGLFRFTMDKYDSRYDFCTHLVAGYAKLMIADDFIDFNFTFVNPDNHAFYNDVNSAKLSHPGLKTILSIGGPETESRFFTLLALERHRNVYIDGLIDYVTSLNFDGIDLAWFYPSAKDTQLFADLLDVIKRRSEGKLIITATVSGIPFIIKKSYVPISLVKSVDFLNVQTFGYHDSKHTTGLISPLFPRPNDTSKLNVADSMNLWAELGIPKSKLVMGITAYGHSYILDDKQNWGIGAPAQLAPPFKPYLAEGTIPYYDLYRFLDLEVGDHVLWDEAGQVPWILNNTFWISYENPISVTRKMRFVKENGFGGAFLNELEYDNSNEFQWGFTDERFLLLRAMKQGLEKEYPTEAPPATETPTTTMNPSLNPCIRDNSTFKSPWVGDVDDCKRYYYCIGTVPYHLSCGNGLFWNFWDNKCVFYKYSSCPRRCNPNMMNCV
uniref:Chitin-binding type-2 domain-containing protein n=1 Tax=Panagrellus redivivus TaxID=6233 RepID=A0A7E4UQC1_PANRE